MKFLKFAPLLLILVLSSCNKDDDNTIKVEPPRDESEVYQEDLQEIKTFLNTHFFTVITDSTNNYKSIVFDTIAGENSGKTPLMDSPELKSKTFTPGTFEYTLYYLQIQKGAESAYQPTFGDKITFDYVMYDLQVEQFEKAYYPRLIDIPGSQDLTITKGTISAITEFKGTSGFTENPDGTISYPTDFGLGAVFVPSGLGYFQNPPAVTGLSAYEPFIMTFRLFDAVQMDHDGDGVPSIMEDVNGNHYLLDEDTDGDGISNFKDNDDDGDGLETRLEITVDDANNDGIITKDEIILTDSNNSGTPDYLDPAVY